MARSGKKLRNVRETLELSPAGFASKAGLSENYVLQMETDRKPITDSVLVKIARGIGWSVDDLDRELGSRVTNRGAA